MVVTGANVENLNSLSNPETPDSSPNKKTNSGSVDLTEWRKATEPWAVPRLVAKVPTKSVTEAKMIKRKGVRQLLSIGPASSADGPSGSIEGEGEGEESPGLARSHLKN